MSPLLLVLGLVHALEPTQFLRSFVRAPDSWQKTRVQTIAFKYKTAVNVRCQHFFPSNKGAHLHRQSGVLTMQYIIDTHSLASISGKGVSWLVIDNEITCTFIINCISHFMLKSIKKSAHTARYVALTHGNFCSLGLQHDQVKRFESRRVKSTFSLVYMEVLVPHQS